MKHLILHTTLHTPYDIIHFLPGQNRDGLTTRVTSDGHRWASRRLGCEVRCPSWEHGRCCEPGMRRPWKDRTDFPHGRAYPIVQANSYLIGELNYSELPDDNAIRPTLTGLLCESQTKSVKPIGEVQFLARKTRHHTATATKSSSRRDLSFWARSDLAGGPRRSESDDVRKQNS